MCCCGDGARVARGKGKRGKAARLGAQSYAAEADAVSAASFSEENRHLCLIDPVAY